VYSRIKREISKRLTKEAKNKFKRALWKSGVGHIFRTVASDKVKFEKIFKQAPASIMIYPTNLCNALCSFCAYPTNTDPKKIMPNEIAFKAIDDLIAMGGGTIADFTTNLGDPLVDPNLADKLAYAKSKGVRITRFFTNGILLDRTGLIEKVAPHLDELHVSLPGLDRKNYLEVFRVDKAEKVGRGLIKLGEHKARTGKPGRVFIEIRASRALEVVMQDEGMRHLKPYFDTGVFELGFVRTTYENWSGVISDKEMIGDMKLIRRPPVKKDIPCGLLFFNPGVLPDGHMRACSCWYLTTNYDKLTLPKITERPLADILFGDEHRKIMLDWTDGDLPPPCSGCSNYEPAFFSLKDVVKMATSIR